MLVLSRKTSEVVVINVPGMSAPIRLTIVSIERGKTRIGLEADPSVSIFREELLPIDRDRLTGRRGGEGKVPA